MGDSPRKPTFFENKDALAVFTIAAWGVIYFVPGTDMGFSCCTKWDPCGFTFGTNYN